MANTNLYNVLSGLLSAAQNFNGKIGSKNAQNGTIYEQLTAISGVAGNAMSQMNLANGATSGLVYAPTTGGDVSIAAGVITVKNEAVTSGKLASSVNADIADGKAAYGIVSSTDGEWHKHTNKTVLDGVTSTKISNWDDAATKAHEHDNKTVLDGINAGKVAAWDNGAAISAVTLETTATETGYAASYQLKVNGAAVGSKINIVKDQFLKNASIVVGNWSGTTFTPSISGTGKAIALEIFVNEDGSSSGDTKVTTIYINPAEFITAYTGGTNIEITAGNVIQLSGTIASGNIADAASWNTAASQGAAYAAASGTLVKTSGATTFTADTVVLGNGSQQVKNSSYTVATASGDFGANTLATAPAITGYIAAQNFQSANPDYVTASADLTAEQIVLGNGNKTVKQSGLTVGTTSGAIATAASGSVTIPRSDAVSAYVANKTADMVTAPSEFIDGQILLGINNTREIASTSYKVYAGTTSGGFVNNPNAQNLVPNIQATKAYIDAKDAENVSSAENYILNGNASTGTGVDIWDDDASTEGSLANLNASIEALLSNL